MKGDGHEVPPLAEDLLAVDSCWEQSRCSLICDPWFIYCRAGNSLPRAVGSKKERDVG